jgi:hypothetical protein
MAYFLWLCCFVDVGEDDRPWPRSMLVVAAVSRGRGRDSQDLRKSIGPVRLAAPGEVSETIRELAGIGKTKFRPAGASRRHKLFGG